MADYSTQQIAFAFSMITNAAVALPAGDSEEVYEQAIVKQFEQVTQAFPQDIGTGWSIVWGPQVYSSPTDQQPTADNALLVVQGTDGNGNPLTIVATAATNPTSQFDKVDEDLALALVPFAGGGQISTGTNTGLKILLGMTSNGATLQQFLTANANPNATLVFTGHSLGGALTPALALSIDTTGWGQVFALPTAGLTPGDADFVAAFTAKFPSPSPGGPTSTWNRNVVNELDALPKLWADVADISGLYPQLGKPTECVRKIQRKAVAHAGSPNPFANIPQVTFSAGFQTPSPPPVQPKNGTLLFLSEVLWQHIDAYGKEIIPDIAPHFEQLTLTEQHCQSVLQWCSKR